MPEPLHYLQAFVVVASASALVVLALGWRKRPPSATRVCSVCLAGVAIGQIVGIYQLRLLIGWPPASALDRYLAILLPTAISVELLAAYSAVPRWVAYSLRCLLAASIGRVLLHGSVYLDEWTSGQAIVVFAVTAIFPVAVWLLLARLAERSPGISLPLALAVTIQGAGMAIMLAGYLKGGAAAMVAAAALLGASLGSTRMTKHIPPQAVIGLGMVSLSSLLIIGVFFGRLPTVSALVLLATPLLCWFTELPWLQKRTPWQHGAIRLVLVAVALAIVLLAAKGKFDREFRPLLSRVGKPFLQDYSLISPLSRPALTPTTGIANHCLN
ncbi:MAG TPA: hypothetical protein VL096_18415 [Pirellulaceae bacterium]|nr:hypothetical protein [Pirellulaceae bacterium]